MKQTAQITGKRLGVTNITPPCEPTRWKCTASSDKNEDKTG